MCVLSIKVPIRKKSGNLFNDPRNIKINKMIIARKQELKEKELYGYFKRQTTEI